jgi:TldD protein
MTDLALTDDLFFTKTGMDQARVEKIVAEALQGMDDGELFLEYSQSESLTLDDGRIKSASFDTAQGFGLRGISDEAAGYAHASELSEDAIRRAGQTVRAVRQGHSGTLAAPPPGTNRQLYTDANPLHQVDFAAKTKLLAEIDAYARSKDSRVKQVSASLSGIWQAVQIIRADGRRVGDVRPLVRLNVSIVVGEGDKMESGTSGTGGRLAYERFIDPTNWKAQVDEAGQSRQRAGAGRRDAGRTRPRLARRDAARSGRPRARRRFQSQEDVCFCGSHRPARRLARRHRR